MAAETVYTITVALNDNPEASALKYVKKYHDGPSGLVALIELLQCCVYGGLHHTVTVSVDEGDGTAAAETIACVQTNATAGDTVTICGVEFTVAASASDDPLDGEFEAGANDNAMATNLGAAVTAHPALFGLLTAAVVTDTVTCTMTTGGAAGNHGKVSTSDATAFTLGSGTFASGAVGTTESAIRAFRGGLA